MKIKSLRFKNLILVAIFALMSGSVWAYDFTVDGIYYHITDATNFTVEVTSNNGAYNSYSGAVVIPATVTNPNDNQVYSVTAIGAAAFRECTGLTSVNGDSQSNVNIPANITSIGSQAFLACSGLTGSLTIPATVTSMGNCAFQHCTGLTSVSINMDIPDGAFTNCTNLATLQLGNNVTSIGGSAFSQTALSGILSIPDGVTSIGAQAFQDLTDLTTLSIGTGLASIGNYAFDGCTGLTSISFGTHAFTIGSNAFQDCTGLASLTLPSNLTSIGQGAFQGCSGLANIYFHAANCSVNEYYVWDGCSHACTVTIGDDIASVPNHAFRNFPGLNAINWGNHTTFTVGNYAFYNTGLTTITIPEYVTSIGSNAFAHCDHLTRVNYNAINSAVGSDAWNGVVTNVNRNITLVIGDGVTTIPNQAFARFSGLRNVTIGESVTSIGDMAFYYSEDIETVNYNATNCTTVPNDLWQNCRSLRTVNIGDNVTHIRRVFYNTDITAVNFGDDPHLEYIGPNAFWSCDYLTSFTIPNTVTTIGDQAFMWDDHIETLTIGSGVTSIGGSAFRSCSGLETINWNVTNTENNLSLGSNCFTGIGNAEQHDCALIVGDNVIALPNSIFSSCSGITSLTLGSRLQTIGDYAFSGCNHIGAITIPNDVTNLGKDAFKNCSAATTLSIGAGVQTIKEGTFCGCSGLTSLTIPSSLTTIGGEGDLSGAFSGCTGLTSLDIPDNVTYIGRDAFSGCSNITTITIGDGVTYIGRYAFSGCTNLTEITIGEGVTNIMDYAFQNNSNLATVNYNATNCPDLDINNELWQGCSHDCTVHIGSNVIRLPKKMFYNFSHLTAVDFGSTSQLTTIGSDAFKNCTGLTTVVIPNSVTTIDSDAFEGCTGMTSLNLGTGVQTIGVRAFKGCTGLTTLMIPASVTNIEGVGWTGTGAFDGCTGLTEIWFMGTTQPSINSFAFDGVSETIPLYYPKGYSSSYTYGRFANKIPFSRFDGGSGETGAQWGGASNWAFGIPQYNEAALINATAIIPGAYTVNVDHIAFTGSNYMIIENAGQLSCNSIASHNVNTVTIRNDGQLICNTAVQGTVQKTIAAYTSNNDGWNFIASPVTETLGYNDVTGLLPTNADEYDLYYLEEETTMWRNFKQGNEHSGFDIEHNKGYLYAHSTVTTISFAGTIQPYVAEGVSIDLAKAGNGWNLVGNPFAFNAYANKPYYVINGRNVEVYTGTDPIAPCTGIIVKADPESSESEAVLFTKNAPGAATSNLQIAVSQTVVERGLTSSTTLDNAIVSFNEGSTLEKFVFNNDNAKLYIPQGGKDFAIAYSDGQGEMPLNFEANENGSFTITFSIENTEMNYLHLIDNLTGADIDLLATPSYCFEAKTTDYASRFRLVFDANGSSTCSEAEVFAFYDGREWVIANTDEATLQVVDMTGRVLSTETISGNATININQPAGVYVMRLVNGENVKVQKVVLR